MSSIPERLLRIARHKFDEVRHHIERLDNEIERSRSAPEASRAAARELSDSVRPAEVQSASPRPGPGAGLRTPEEIARGAKQQYQGSSQTGSGTGEDLLYHYRLLGVEPGSEFATVQAAYNKLAARCDPARFPAGSAEAKEADEIRSRLHASYRVLREALDPTARRFDLLELDKPGLPS